MKTEIIKSEPEFRPVVLQITLETPEDVRGFMQSNFYARDGEDEAQVAVVALLRQLRDSL